MTDAHDTVYEKISFYKIYGVQIARVQPMDATDFCRSVPLPPNEIVMRMRHGCPAYIGSEEWQEGKRAMVCVSECRA